MLTIPDILLSITALCNVGLSLFVQARNRSSRINFFFSLFSISLALWAVALIMYRLIDDTTLSLYFMKGSYISALLIAVSFYFFSILFPDEPKISRRQELLIFVPAIGYIALLLAIPSFLTRGIVTHEWGKETILSTPEFLLFCLIFVYLFVGGIIRIWRKLYPSRGTLRLQLLMVGGSVTVAGCLGMFFNLVLPSPFLQDFRYIWTGPLFTFFIAVTITYSIFRFRYFNPRAILAELLVFILVLFLFVRLVFTGTLTDLAINGGLLLAVSLVGMLLIRSVSNEVEQRELIESQKRDLEIANQDQESLLHFMSHEIKGYLTKSEAVFSAVSNGDFGAVPPKVQEISDMALVDTRKGVDTVMGILDAANLKKGTVSFKKDAFDLVACVDGVVAQLQRDADEKGLQLVFDKPVTGAYHVTGDREKIERHVIRNVIDNSIKYTPHGSVKVELSRNDRVARIVVTDTGVGITPDDMQRLFTEGGHGKDSIRTNVHSTGYGLYIAKKVIEAHGGTIRAESEGKDKGSRFVVELPLTA